MRNFFLNAFFALAGMIALVACSDDSSSSRGSGNTNPEDPAGEQDTSLVKLDSVHQGMIQFTRGGLEVTLGTNEASAKVSEKPEMKVTLDYGFSLDVHEVTCGEFSALLKKYPWASYPACESDSVPVVNVTFYDAVLYANARSKAEGYDTVYTYLERNFSSGHNCIGLEGLTFDADVDGYRLPTEAEWIFAASLGWNPPDSWNVSTSKNQLHKVCSSSQDEAGFCDLSGNALEWTNDWLGGLVDSSVVNYVGSPSGNSFGEKVVKGGYFAQTVESMQLYSRGDVYPISASTSAAYLGFRLAFGAIDKPLWLDDKGRTTAEPSSFSSPLSALVEKTGTYRAKLVFRNDITGNLEFADYGKSPLKFVEIADTISSFHPDISPDGSKVAFCTGLEGVKGKSRVYVRNLDEGGRGLVMLDVENAVIPRWVVEDNGDTSIVYVDESSDNSNDGDFTSRATWIVSFMNGKFGKPRKLLEGAYHGGIDLNSMFAVSGSKLLRAYKGKKHQVWYDEEQACNVSLSKDGALNTLFLDFGGKAGQEFSGKQYRTHERILVADSNGKLVRSIPSPKGRSFDHSEWVNQKNLVVATLVGVNGNHGDIALVDVSDSSIVELVSGEELWHPCLWVKGRYALQKEGLDLDSAGVYIDDSYEIGEKTMGVKMRMFWDMVDSVELIGVGSSRMERGFDPRVMKACSFNFGHIGGELWGSLALAHNYIFPHAKKLKYLVVEVSPDLMRNSRLVRETYVFGQAPGYIYDRHHDYWHDGLPEEFVELVDYNHPYTYEDSTSYVNTLGLFELEPGSWGESPMVTRDSIMNKTEDLNYHRVIDSLEVLIDTTQNRGVQIIAVVFPQSPLYSQTGYYGRHGIKRTLAKETLDYLDSLTRKYPHFHVLDENKMGRHDYPDSLAMDYDHLSKLGAQQVSRRLDSLIQKLK